VFLRIDQHSVFPASNLRTEKRGKKRSSSIPPSTKEEEKEEIRDNNPLFLTSQEGEGGTTPVFSRISVQEKEKRKGGVPEIPLSRKRGEREEAIAARQRARGERKKEKRPAHRKSPRRTKKTFSPRPSSFFVKKKRKGESPTARDQQRGKNRFCAGAIGRDKREKRNSPPSLIGETRRNRKKKGKGRKLSNPRPLMGGKPTFYLIPRGKEKGRGEGHPQALIFRS